MLSNLFVHEIGVSVDMYLIVACLEILHRQAHGHLFILERITLVGSIFHDDCLFVEIAGLELCIAETAAY